MRKPMKTIRECLIAATKQNCSTYAAKYFLQHAREMDVTDSYANEIDAAERDHTARVCREIADNLAQS